MKVTVQRFLVLGIVLPVLVFAPPIGMGGNNNPAFAQSMPASMMSIAGPTILKGSIANVQLDNERNPEWIESGFWVLRLREGPVESDLPLANLVARISMVKVDGTAAHNHTIHNLTLTNASIEGNATIVFNGTATITMRDGPVSSVPIAVKIFNGAAGAMWIGPDRIDSHFGTNPVYGTLSESSKAVFSEIRDGTDMDGMPVNVNSTMLESKPVNYYGDATGYMAYPKNGTDLPAVVMIHEWWGLNQNIKNMADQLANEGYAVLAVDLYGGEVATESERAGQLASSVRNNPDGAVNNLNAAVEYVSLLQIVNSSRIASLGWCFGGGQSLQLALNTDQPLAATVIYYGTLVTNQTELAEISWPVLGIFGSTDQSIPVEMVNQFDAALDASGVTNEIYIYEGVGHAFANPSGDNYAPKETSDAWKKTLAFLNMYV